MTAGEHTWDRLSPDDFTAGLTVGTQPPIGRVRTMLRLARRLGFDVAWTVDHFQGFFPQVIWDRDLSWVADPESSPHAYFDYQMLLGNLAARAKGIRLGVGVTEPVRRHPMLIAQAFLTLAHLTDHAPILGIGAGERENIEPYGLSFDQPVGRLEDALPVIRKAFDSRGPFGHDGPFYRFDDAVLDLQAPAGRTPEIWVAAHGPRMLRLAGEYGDGWYPTLPMLPGEYEAKLRTLRASAAAAGRAGAAITPGWQAFVVVARTERSARAMLDTRAVRFTALLADAALWSSFGVPHPFGDEFRGMVDFVPQRYSRAELDAAMAAVPVDAMADVVLWGTPTQLKARFGEYRDAGLRHLVAQPASAMISKRHALYSLAAIIRIARYLKRR